MEELLVPSSHYFGRLQYPEILVPLRQYLFLETAKSGEKGADVPFQ